MFPATTERGYWAYWLAVFLGYVAGFWLVSINGSDDSAFWIGVGLLLLSTSFALAEVWTLIMGSPKE